MKAQYIGSKKLYDEHGVEIDVSVTSFDFDLKGWRRVWITQLLKAFDEIIGGKKIKVAEYIINKRDSNNMIIATYRKIQKDTDTSSRTVADTIQAMKRADLIKVVQSGVYHLNPSIVGIFGEEGKTIRLMQEYRIRK